MGVDAILDKIGNSPQYLHDVVLQKIRENSEKMAGIQKENCPFDTSMLRESIHTFVEDNGDVISGGSRSNISYAAYVEFGTGQNGDTKKPLGVKDYDGTGHPLDDELGITRKTEWAGQRAQPFMYPGMKAVEGDVQRDFGSAVEEVFKK